LNQTGSPEPVWFTPEPVSPPSDLGLDWPGSIQRPWCVWMIQDPCSLGPGLLFCADYIFLQFLAIHTLCFNLYTPALPKFLLKIPKKFPHVFWIIFLTFLWYFLYVKTWGKICVVFLLIVHYFWLKFVKFQHVLGLRILPWYIGAWYMNIPCICPWFSTISPLFINWFVSLLALQVTWTL
jgi:hypothetical protein